MKYLTRRQAAELLASLLNEDANKLYNFLARNSRNRNGYRITTHVVNGKLAYTESALLEFVRVTLTPHKETIK